MYLHRSCLLHTLWSHPALTIKSLIAAVSIGPAAKSNKSVLDIFSSSVPLPSHSHNAPHPGYHSTTWAISIHLCFPHPFYKSLCHLFLSSSCHFTHSTPRSPLKTTLWLGSCSIYCTHFMTWCSSNIHSYPFGPFCLSNPSPFPSSSCSSFNVFPLSSSDSNSLFLFQTLQLIFPSPPRVIK